MLRTAHRILAAFMVLWMPFCCCQVRAAAHVAAHVAVGHAASTGEVGGSCCAATDCCGNEFAEHPGEAVDGCCTPHEGSPHAPAKGADCCTTCKERVPPPAAPSLLPADTVGAELPPWQEAPVVAAASDVPPRHARVLQGDAGPPPRPAGRDALTLNAVLLI